MKELKKIEQHQPENTNVLVDLFGGGGSVFLDEKIECEKRVYNDINKCLTEIFKLAKSGNLQEVTEKINDVNHTLENPFTEQLETEIEKFLFCAKNAMRGIIKKDEDGKISDCMVRYKNNTTEFHKGEYKLDFQEYKTFLENATILNKDWKEVFNKYDKKDNFIFLDPPYNFINKSSKYAKKEFDVEQLLDMIELLKDAKCNWMFICPDVGYVRNLFKDFTIRESYPIKYNAAIGKICVGTYHILITNY